MNRKDWLKASSAIGLGSMLPVDLIAQLRMENELRKSDFGKDFVWGTATAAYQIEGGWN